MAKKSSTKPTDKLPKELTDALGGHHKLDTHDVGDFSFQRIGKDGASPEEIVEQMHQALHGIYDGNASVYGRTFLEQLEKAPGIAAMIEADKGEFALKKSGKQTDYARGFLSALSVLGSMTGIAMKQQAEGVVAVVNDPALPLEVDKGQVLTGAFTVTVSFAALTQAVFGIVAKVYDADKHDDLGLRIGHALHMLDRDVHVTAMGLAEKVAEVRKAEAEKVVH